MSGFLPGSKNLSYKGITEKLSSILANAHTQIEDTEKKEEAFRRQTSILDNALRVWLLPYSHIQVDPENPGLYVGKANLFIAHEAYEEALGLLQKALWLDPANKEINTKYKDTVSASGIAENGPHMAYIKGAFPFPSFVR